jgi:hypothetical protein
MIFIVEAFDVVFRDRSGINVNLVAALELQRWAFKSPVLSSMFGPEVGHNISCKDMKEVIYPPVAFALEKSAFQQMVPSGEDHQLKFGAPTEIF